MVSVMMRNKVEEEDVEISGALYANRGRLYHIDFSYLENPP